MSTTISRAGVDAAEPLTFPDRKPDLLIAVKAQLDGFPIELSFTGSVDQLPRIVKRLRELGAAPAGPVAVAQGFNSQPEKPRKRELTEPEYNGGGDACCPKHHKPLKEGQWGKYCPARDDSTERGFCSLKFNVE